MKPGLAIAQTLPAGPQPPAGREIPFPERSTVSRLRTLRESLRKKGRVAEALKVAERLMELAPGRESAWRLGVMQREMGLYRESLKTFRDALRYQEGPAYAVAEIHLHAAFSWYFLNEFKRMGECLRRAYALRPKTRSDYVIHTTIGGFFMTRKRYAEARAEFEKAGKAARTALERGRALGNRGLAAYYLGESAEAGRRLDEAVLIHKRAGQAKDAASLRYLRGILHLDEGSYGRARSIFVRSAWSLRRSGVREREAICWGDAGNASVMMEDWRGAKPLLDRAANLADVCQNRRLTVVVHALRAQVNARLGMFSEASADLAEAQAGMKGLRDYVGSVHIYRAQARIAELFGEWTEMRFFARRAERYAKRENDRPRIAEFRKIRANAEHELGRRRAAYHARKTAKWVADLVGRGSSVMQAVRHEAARLAKAELPLLLTGESGTGKTELAREIHAASPRAGGPFVTAACETLVFAASDLNGHAEGAWSGARGRAEGLVRKAAGGTLVLDRVDELDVASQRVLIPIVEGRVRAVGSEVEERVDYRVVAVCRRPEQLIPELRNRLEGARIELPPLRERAEDVPALVRKMLGEKVRITEDALALLARQRWEGNLAELKGFVERMAPTSGGKLGVQAVQGLLQRRPSRRARRAREIVQLAEAFAT